MKRSISATALGLCIFWGCAGSDPISRSIAATVNRGPGTQLILSDHAKFEWDRACVFGPYTSDQQVDAISGITGASKYAFDVRQSEGIDVVMFVRQSQITKSIAHSRRGADFGPELVGKCYPRGEAVFMVRTPPSKSWGEIGPR